MRIALWTVITLWVAAATWWLNGHAPWAPWWVRLGLGLGIGSALYVLIGAVRESRPPKPPKKSFPTTPR